jgi:UDP-N-acetylmuramoyl-tripeptide--D-alanyl-D-alanine ligase
MNIEEIYKIYQQFPSIRTDSRKIEKDDIFFALKGPNFNGICRTSFERWRCLRCSG